MNTTSFHLKVNLFKDILDNFENGINLKLVDFTKVSYFDYIKGCYKINDQLLADESNYKFLTLNKNLTRITQIIACLSLMINRDVYVKSNSTFINESAYISKREIYYSNIELFQSMGIVNSVILDICCMLHQDRISLNIFSSAKGLVYSPLTFITDLGNNLNSLYTCNLISNDYITNDFIIDWKNSTDVEFILILEKETIFQNIINNPIYKSKFRKSIVITGKGYPDYCTRVFISKIKNLINQRKAIYKLPPVKLLYFGDWDVYGIEIWMIYSFGSISSIYENEHISISGLFWIGVYKEQLLDNDLFDINNKSIKQNQEDNEDDIIQDSEEDPSTVEDRRAELLLSHPASNITFWKDSIYNTIIETNYVFKSLLEKYSYIDLNITIESMSLISKELMKIKELKKRAEAEAIIQKNFNQFLTIVNQKLFYIDSLINSMYS